VPKPLPSCFFSLVDDGLVLIESCDEDERCDLFRPASVGGTPFPDWEGGVNVGHSIMSVRVNAPPASVYPTGRGKRKRWVVDISVPAVPGPGPVWFHQAFITPEEAVDAIRRCYFGDLVDFEAESLGPWKSTPG